MSFPPPLIGVLFKQVTLSNTRFEFHDHQLVIALTHAYGKFVEAQVFVLEEVVVLLISLVYVDVLVLLVIVLEEVIVDVLVEDVDISVDVLERVFEDVIVLRGASEVLDEAKAVVELN